MRVRWLARLLRGPLRRLARRREPNFRITRDGGSRVYLRRWWLISRNSYFNVYLHEMLLDDDVVLHDHPYWSVSLVLTNGLMENYKLNPETPELSKRRWLREGQVVLRSSTFAHQLIVAKPAWTLFVTGPRIREWGFWCPRGWIPWRQYVGEGQDSGKPGGVSGIGRGCGEQ